jgi:hypothetical protein
MPIDTLNAKPFFGNLTLDYIEIRNSRNVEITSRNLWVYRILMSHLSEVRHKYNEYRKNDPAKCGTITIEIKIDSIGNVIKNDVISSGFFDSVFDDQIKRVISKWRFNINELKK